MSNQSRIYLVTDHGKLVRPPSGTLETTQTDGERLAQRFERTKHALRQLKQESDAFLKREWNIKICLVMEAEAKKALSRPELKLLDWKYWNKELSIWQRTRRNLVDTQKKVSFRVNQ